MNKNFDLIVFDWDGTLIDSIAWITHCFEYAAERCELAFPGKQQAKNVIGLSIENAVQALFPDADVISRAKLIRRYSETYHSQELNRAHFFPGAYEMLVELKASGISLAVATGKTRKGLESVLHSTDTADLFEITRCADESESKPSPKMLHEILAHCQIRPERALMVGDTTFDLMMARNANMQVAAVTCGAHDELLLQDCEPTWCLQSVTELLEILN